MNLKKSAQATRMAFSQRMKEYGAMDSDFVVFEADIGHSTGSYLFGSAYRSRYFNMGIAEQNMVACAAGMAADGRTVIASSYGVFLTMRALETVRSFICYPNLNVKFLGSHGGVTAAIDGVTHQATEDIGILTTLPNMKVLCPADEASARASFDLAMRTTGPVYVRLMRDPLYKVYETEPVLEMGGSTVLRSGEDITIATYGDTVFQALEAADKLEEKGIRAEIIDMYSIKPFDSATLLESLAKTDALVVVENHQQRNGLGSELARFCLTHKPVAFGNIGLNDTFAESGAYTTILDTYGLSSRHIVSTALGVLKKKEEAAFA